MNGEDGAGEIAKVLSERGVKELEYILDEGLTIIKNAVPGVTKHAAAMIGVTEKGAVNVKLEVKMDQAGHSSMPPRETAITILANELSRFHSNVQPTFFGQVERDMISSLAPYASFPFSLVYSNLWLFSTPISWVLAGKPSTNALIRTTTAATLVRGGVKDNVIPSSASAIVNHRVHPDQTVNDVVKYVKSYISDPRVKVSVEGESFEPHPISDFSNTSFAFNIIADSLTSVFDNVVPCAGTLVGGTDTKHYLKFTKNVYRAVPVVMTLDDVKMIHGHDERISVENYMQLIQYYANIIVRSDN